MSNATIYFFLAAMIWIALLMNLINAKGKSPFWHRSLYLGMVTSGACMVCWATPPLRDFAHYFMYSGMAVTLNFVWIDYLMVTWVPDQVENIRKRNRPVWIAIGAFLLAILLSLLVESYQHDKADNKAQLGLVGMVYRLLKIGERVEYMLDKQQEHDRKKDIQDSLQWRQIQRNTRLIQTQEPVPSSTGNQHPTPKKRLNYQVAPIGPGRLRSTLEQDFSAQMGLDNPDTLYYNY